MALSEIVNVSIQAGTVSPARRGFGTLLLLMYHTAWTGNEVRTYTTFSGVAADFSPNSPVYKAAAVLFSQNPRPEKVKVGRLPAHATNVHTTVLDFTDMADGTDVVMSVESPDGTVTEINVAWDTDKATTLTAVGADLDAIPGLDVTVASPTITVAASNPGPVFFYDVSGTTGLHVRDITEDLDYDDTLDTILTLDADWYGVAIDVNSPKNMDKVARWALANDRVAGFGPQYTKPSQFGSGEFSTSADYTALLSNDSAFGLFTKAPRSSFPEVAWFGTMFPRDPGSATWAFKTLEGVGADSWTSTERATIEGSGVKGNHYAAEAEVGITRPGKTFGGEWIDVTIGLAWLQARLEERLFALLVNNPKIPYTDAGIALVAAEVRAQLQEAEDRGLIDSGWTVTTLAAASQDSADRAARILRGVEFQARLAGAIHKINIAGTVTA